MNGHMLEFSNYIVSAYMYYRKSSVNDVSDHMLACYDFPITLYYRESRMNILETSC